MFKTKIEEEGIDMKLYARYVVDETVVCKSIPERNENINQEKDERTMKKLQEIGNSIHPLSN